MYYKLRPHKPVQWCPLLTTATSDLLNQLGKPLSVLPWEDVDQPLTADVLALALRHGEISDDGLYLEMDYVHSLNELNRMIETRDSVRANRIYDSITGEEFNPGLVDIADRVVQIVQERVDTNFNSPVKSELEAHWKSLV